MVLRSSTCASSVTRYAGRPSVAPWAWSPCAMAVAYWLCLPQPLRSSGLAGHSVERSCEERSLVQPHRAEGRLLFSLGCWCAGGGDSEVAHAVGIMRP